MGEEDIELHIISIFYIPALLEATVSKTSPQAKRHKLLLFDYFYFFETFITA